MFHAHYCDSLDDFELAKQHLWILELHHGVDNRLTQEFIHKAFLPALDAVEREWRVAQRAAVKKPQEGRGALIIVGKKDQDKFFSNGVLIWFLLQCCCTDLLCV